MNTKQKIVKKIIICFIVAVGSLSIPYIQTIASNINTNEQQVIDTISGTFEVEGKKYKAKTTYIEEVRAFLASDEVELTKEQANKLIQQIYSNVELAISDGYIILVEDTTNIEETTSNETTKTNDNNIETNENNTQTNEEPTQTNENLQETIPNNINDTENSENNTQTNENTIQTNENQQNLTTEDIFENNNKSTENISKETDNAHIDDKETDNLESYNNYTKNTSTNETTQALKSNIIKKILLGITILLTIVIITVFIHRYKNQKHIVSVHPSNQSGYIDIHSHILPGVDDGARNIEETIQMLLMAHEQGIRTIIATPHYHLNKKTPLNKIMEITKTVQKEAQKIDKDFRIIQGNEIYYEQGCIEALKQGKASTMADSQYVLIEFSMEESYNTIYNAMRDFILEGYIPIIAHIERYRCLMKKKERVISLIQLGCYIQINIESIQNSFLNPHTAYIKKLISENLVHFIASDCHNIKERKPTMETNLNILRKTIDEETITKMVITNPTKIIEKKYI